jgi:WD40 repeat protein
VTRGRRILDAGGRGVVALAVDPDVGTIAVAYVAAGARAQLTLFDEVGGDWSPASFESGGEATGSEVLVMTFVSRRVLAVATSEGDQRAVRVDLRTGEQEPTPSPKYVRWLASATDGLLACSGEEVLLLKVAPGDSSVVRAWPASVDPIDEDTFAPVALAPNGTTATACRQPGLLEIWPSPVASQPSVIAESTPPHARWVGLDRTGTWVALIDNDLSMVGVWETGTGRRHRSSYFGEELSLVNLAAFHPRESVLATALLSGVVQVHDVTDGALLGSRRLHEGRVTGMAFTPEGEIVTGGEDGVVAIWDGRS